MQRIESRRRFSLVLLVLLFAGVGPALVYRSTRLHTSPPEHYVVGLVLGAAAGIVLAVILYAYYARHDIRRLEVARQRPHAHVIQAKVDPGLVQALQQVSPGLALSGAFVTVAFEPEGVSFWTGSTKPERVILIPARDVIEVTVGESLRVATSRSPAVGRMKVVAKTASGRVDILFGVDHIPVIGTVGNAMSTRGVAQVVDEANTARGAARSSLPGAGTTTSTGPDLRVPGRTAYAALRNTMRGWIVILVIMGILLVALFTLIGAKDEDGQTLVILLFILLVPAMLVIQRLVKGPNRRERAAGYTTLNHDNFDLQQLHPYTGQVIRKAGGLPISKEEFARLLVMR